MNLHALVRGPIQAVNTDTSVSFYASTGYATSASGKQTPQYAAAVTVRAQIQDLSQKDIDHLDSLNIQGSQRVMFLFGSVNGIIRASQKGGDLIYVTSESSLWLTTAVLEAWPGWCKVAVTQQVGSPPS